MAEDGTKEDQRDAQRGLKCRHCGCRHFRVVYTRAARGGKLVRRALEKTLGLQRKTYRIRVAGVDNLYQTLRQLYNVNEDPHGPSPHLGFGFAIGADHTIVYRIDGGEGTVAHELVHVIVFNQLPTTPTWFEEALASNFEEYRIENGEIAGLFRLDHWRMNFMRENQQEAGPFDIDSLPPIGDIARRNQRLVMMFKEEAPVRETTFSFPELDQVTAKMFVMFLQEKGKLRSVVHALGHQDLESRFETQLTTIRESVGDDYERQWRIWLDRKLRQAGAKTIFTENRIRK